MNQLNLTAEKRHEGNASGWPQQKKITNAKTKMVIFRYPSHEPARQLVCWFVGAIYWFMKIEDEPNHFDRKTKIQPCNLVILRWILALAGRYFVLRPTPSSPLLRCMYDTIVAWFKQFSINNRSKVSFSMILKSTSIQLPFVIVLLLSLTPTVTFAISIFQWHCVLIYLYRLYH